MSNRTSYKLTPAILLRAYAAGIFPMANNAASKELRWFDPPIRAIIPLDEHFHIPRRLKRTIRHRPFTIKFDASFRDVMLACAAPRPDHPETWINNEIVRLYTELHHMGHAHSIEAWQDNQLVGGLYGVSLGTAFFGESMFSRVTDASKIALVYLVALMRYCGLTLLDTQFQTDHLARFGTFEITRDHYHHLLTVALQEEAKLKPPPDDGWHHLVAGALQPTSHIS